VPRWPCVPRVLRRVSRVPTAARAASADGSVCRVFGQDNWMGEIKALKAQRIEKI